MCGATSAGVRAGGPPLTRTCVSFFLLLLLWNNTSAVHQLVHICIRWYIYVFASIIRGLLSRVQIVSGFMKDAQLGLKRLASMPDRTTNTISTEEGLPCTHSCVFVSAVTGLHMKISISTSVYMHPYAQTPTHAHAPRFAFSKCFLIQPGAFKTQDRSIGRP